MFGWFRPHCPVNPPDKVWIERRMTWLAHVLGLERCRDAQVVLPTAEFFPDPYDGEEADVRPLLERVCGYMGIDPGRFDLDFYDERPDDDRDPLGVYIGGKRERIEINRSELADPMSLVGTLAHELAHAILLGEGYIANDVPDHEYVTDLLTVFLGLGVFAANSVIRESYSRYSQLYVWQIGARGYLSERSFGYALAIWAWMRGENGADWEVNLRPNVRAVMRDALTYLSKTGDVCPNPMKANGEACWFVERAEAELVADLQSPHSGVRLAALWDMRAVEKLSTQSILLLAKILSDKDEFVRAEAALVLSKTGPSGERAVPALAQAALEDSKLTVRLYAMMALSEIGAHSDQIVPTALYLLNDSDGPVRSAAAKVLGCFGRAAEPAAETLQARLNDADPQVATQAAWALGQIGAKAAVPALIRAFKHGEGELPYIAAGVLADLAPTSQGVLGALTAALSKADYEKRIHAARALAKIGPPAAAAVPALVASLADDDPDAASLANPDLRAQAHLETAVALALIDGQIDTALEVLRESLPPPLGVRSTTAVAGNPWSLWDDVIDALKRLGILACSALLLRLNRARPDNTFAAWALGELGLQAAVIIGALEKALTDSDRFLRLMAACSLWRIQRLPDCVVPVILDCLRESNISLWPGAPKLPLNRAETFRKGLDLLLLGIGQPAVPILLQALDAAPDAPDHYLCRALAALALESESIRRLVSNGRMAWAIKVDDEINALVGQAVRDRLRLMTVGRQMSPDPRPKGDRDFEEGINLLLSAQIPGDETRACPRALKSAHRTFFSLPTQHVGRSSIRGTLRIESCATHSQV
jgi:HEAT repeat protein